MLPHWSETDIDGIHLVRTASNTGKPPLVLVHGFSDNGLCWAPVARELEDSYEIIMPDARGHGRSARVTRGQQIDMIADLAGVLRTLGLAPAIVAGHSMGAGMSSQLAARYPELVRALLLEDPPWFTPPPGAAPQAPRIFDENSPTAVWLRGLQAKTLEEAIAQTHAEHPAFPDEYLRPWTIGKQQLDMNFLTTENNSLSRWTETVPDIHCPTLLVTADPEQGGIVSPDLARQICETNPQFQLAHFPGVGHHVRFAVHQPYMQAVRAFLQSL